MTVLQTPLDRNRAFASGGFRPELRMMPSLRTIVIGCVDPRVDPTLVLGSEPGEVAALRNVGGRVTPDVLDQLALLRAVTQAAGGDLGPGWEFVVLHHTDCGITRLGDHPTALAGFLGVAEQDLSTAAVEDPHAAVTRDLGLLRADPRIAGVAVTGLVYDVTTGLVEPVGSPTSTEESTEEATAESTDA